MSFNIYQGDYRRLIIFPVLLLLASAILIPNIKMGVDFTGGTLISLNLNQKMDAATIKTGLAAEGLNGDVRVFDTAIGPKAEIELAQNPDLVRAEELKGEFGTLLVNVTFLEVRANQNTSVMPEYLEGRKTLNRIADQMFVLANNGKSAEDIGGLNQLQKEFGSAYTLVYGNYREKISSSINKHVSYSSISVQTVSPVLSTHFLEQAKSVVIAAAILTLILVFLFFQDPIPSIAVLTGAVCDVTIAMGAMALFGIPLTIASFAALMMLVGFSLDTDILLTMRLVKRRGGDNREKAFDAMKTGMTMSVMAVVAFGILFILSMMTHISTYYEISAVALAGLAADVVATWCLNAVIILWYLDSKAARTAKTEGG